MFVMAPLTLSLAKDKRMFDLYLTLLVGLAIVNALVLTVYTVRTAILKHNAVSRLKAELRDDSGFVELLRSAKADGQISEEELVSLEARIRAVANSRFQDKKTRARALEGIRQPSGEGRRNFVLRLA